MRVNTVARGDPTRHWRPATAKSTTNPVPTRRVMNKTTSIRFGIKPSESASRVELCAAEPDDVLVTSPTS